MDLFERTLSLVTIASPSRAEAALADHLVDVFAERRELLIDRIGDNIVVRLPVESPSQTLLLAGHLDTVPGDVDPRVEGDTLCGLGAADMKGGLALMVELALTTRPQSLGVTFCFYAREEIDRSESGLLEIAAARPELLRADAAILGEPTAGVVEAGCQGTLRIRLDFGGVRAHTARPWTGSNAIHRMLPALEWITRYEGRRVTIDSCTYVEQLQSVDVSGGVSANVVPDTASLTLNHRFAPDRTPDEAVASLRADVSEFLDPGLGDDLVVLDVARGAPPGLDHPLLAALLASTGAPARAKVGWTDVATFADLGVPALNFGPGDPLVAHHPSEFVTRQALDDAFEALRGVVERGGSVPP